MWPDFAHVSKLQGRCKASSPKTCSGALGSRRCQGRRGMETWDEERTEDAWCAPAHVRMKWHASSSLSLKNIPRGARAVPPVRPGAWAARSATCFCVSSSPHSPIRSPLTTKLSIHLIFAAQACSSALSTIGTHNPEQSLQTFACRANLLYTLSKASAPLPLDGSRHC